MRDKFDIEFTTGLTARKSPDFIDVTYKAVAGVSEKDLIERNTIGEVTDPEDNSADETNNPEEQEKPNV